MGMPPPGSATLTVADVVTHAPDLRIPAARLSGKPTAMHATASIAVERQSRSARTTTGAVHAFSEASTGNIVEVGDAADDFIGHTFAATVLRL